MRAHHCGLCLFSVRGEPLTHSPPHLPASAPRVGHLQSRPPTPIVRGRGGCGSGGRSATRWAASSFVQARWEGQLQPQLHPLSPRLQTRPLLVLLPTCITIAFHWCSWHRRGKHSAHLHTQNTSQHAPTKMHSQTVQHALCARVH